MSVDLNNLIGLDYSRCSRKYIFFWEHTLRVIHFLEEIIFSATQPKSGFLSFSKIRKSGKIWKIIALVMNASLQCFKKCYENLITILQKMIRTHHYNASKNCELTQNEYRLLELLKHFLSHCKVMWKNWASFLTCLGV